MGFANAAGAKFGKDGKRRRARRAEAGEAKRTGMPRQVEGEDARVQGQVWNDRRPALRMAAESVQ